MQERRRYVRWDINAPSTYRLIDSQEEFSCLAKNISNRGIGLTFTEKLNQHNQVVINIPLKNLKSLILKAEVMWQSEEKHSGLYQTGFYFPNIISEEDKEKILGLTGKR